jgi:hypothetical protein
MSVFPNQGPLGASNAGTDPSVIPLTSATVSVGNTATAIATVPGDGAPVVISNGSGAAIYIGNAGVTTSTGLQVAASSSVLVSYGQFAPDFGAVSCSLYGITASGSSTVTYLTLTSWPGNE